ncbi:MAG: galactose oxidase [Bacteroidales bacterium]|jgi:N-acetylneuraminic acid mutarotase|nr:galactose oxidase [Bacteroidales bacterium]MBP7037347.1 galactose oxidase [Bacteroidales bacterium]HPB13535.1 kelch repeat-containing protein [Bacteroidales bacterium]
MTYKEVKIWIKVLVLILAVPFFNSCDKPEEELVGNWVELSDFDGLPRADAVGFVIGNKAYVGTGYDGDNFHNDFWEYDPARNSWTQKASFPGSARSQAVGFSTDTKGFIGTGWDGRYRLKDFYAYDAASNTWAQTADLEGSARRSAVAFSINNKGYVGTGDSVANFKDFWEYDPASDVWNKVSSIGGSKRTSAATFVINGKGYVIGGIDNADYLNDMWRYDPATDEWTKMRAIANVSNETYDDNYSTIKGTGKVGFTINGKGYLATGGMTTGAEVWEYDPVTDLWSEKSNFEGSTRSDAVGFAIGNRGYVTMGKSSAYYFDDIWAFDPDAEMNEYD